jgi:alpha-ribazole phosphatase
MDLVLIRHPAVDVPSGICYGHSDVGLKASAEAGAEAIAATLDRLHIKPREIHASPLTRCASVARALAVRFGQSEHVVHVDTRLAELDFGDWEMRLWDKVPREQLDAWARDIEHGRPHGGESVAMLAARTADWLAEIMARRASPADGDTRTDVPTDTQSEASGDLVVITHAGTARVMTAQALSLPTLTCIDWPLQMGNLCRLVSRRPSSTGADSSATPGAHWALRQWNV